VILASVTVGGCKGIEKVRVIVLLTATPVAVSTGSEDEISNAGCTLYQSLLHNFDFVPFLNILLKSTANLFKNT
jgi:hypothetical protein